MRSTGWSNETHLPQARLQIGSAIYYGMIALGDKKGEEVGVQFAPMLLEFGSIRDWGLVGSYYFEAEAS